MGTLKVQMLKIILILKSNGNKIDVLSIILPTNHRKWTNALCKLLFWMFTMTLERSITFGKKVRK